MMSIMNVNFLRLLLLDVAILGATSSSSGTSGIGPTWFFPRYVCLSHLPSPKVQGSVPCALKTPYKFPLIEEGGTTGGEFKHTFFIGQRDCMSREALVCGIAITLLLPIIAIHLGVTYPIIWKNLWETNQCHLMTSVAKKHLWMRSAVLKMVYHPSTYAPAQEQFVIIWLLQKVFFHHTFLQSYYKEHVNSDHWDFYG